MNRRAVPNNPLVSPDVLCSDLTPVTDEYKNGWFKVYNRGSFFTLEYDRPQVVVLPIVDDEKIVLVRVKRPVIDDTPLELPAGDSQEGESLVEAARRELEEETGIFIDGLDRFESILPISEMPGRIPVLLTVFTVKFTMDEFNSRKPHDDEICSVELFDKKTVVKKICNGEIYLSSPMAILSRFIFQENLAE